MLGGPAWTPLGAYIPSPTQLKQGELFSGSWRERLWLKTSAPPSPVWTEDRAITPCLPFKALIVNIGINKNK